MDCRRTLHASHTKTRKKKKKKKTRMMKKKKTQKTQKKKKTKDADLLERVEIADHVAVRDRPEHGHLVLAIFDLLGLKADE